MYSHRWDAAILGGRYKVCLAGPLISIDLTSVAAGRQRRELNFLSYKQQCHTS